MNNSIGTPPSTMDSSEEKFLSIMDPQVPNFVKTSVVVVEALLSITCLIMNIITVILTRKRDSTLINITVKHRVAMNLLIMTSNVIFQLVPFQQGAWQFGRLGCRMYNIGVVYCCNLLSWTQLAVILRGSYKIMKRKCHWSVTCSFLCILYWGFPVFFTIPTAYVINDDSILFYLYQRSHYICMHVPLISNIFSISMTLISFIIPFILFGALRGLLQTQLVENEDAFCICAQSVELKETPLNRNDGRKPSLQPISGEDHSGFGSVSYNKMSPDTNDVSVQTNNSREKKPLKTAQSNENGIQLFANDRPKPDIDQQTCIEIEINSPFQPNTKKTKLPFETTAEILSTKDVKEIKLICDTETSEFRNSDNGVCDVESPSATLCTRLNCDPGFINCATPWNPNENFRTKKGDDQNKHLDPNSSESLYQVCHQQESNDERSTADGSGIADKQDLERNACLTFGLPLDHGDMCHLSNKRDHKYQATKQSSDMKIDLSQTINTTTIIDRIQENISKSTISLNKDNTQGIRCCLENAECLKSTRKNFRRANRRHSVPPCFPNIVVIVSENGDICTQRDKMTRSGRKGVGFERSLNLFGDEPSYVTEEIDDEIVNFAMIQFRLHDTGLVDMSYKCKDGEDDGDDGAFQSPLIKSEDESHETTQKVHISTKCYVYLSLLHFVVWFPLLLLSLIASRCEQCHVTSIHWHLALLLTYIDLCINPFFFVLSRDWKHFRENEYCSSFSRRRSKNHAK